MALAPYTNVLPDEAFTLDTPNRWPATRIEFSRSRLLRCIWLGVLYAGSQQGRAYSYVADDFGDLVEVKYVGASLQPGRAPI